MNSNTKLNGLHYSFAIITHNTIDQRFVVHIEKKYKYITFYVGI